MTIEQDVKRQLRENEEAEREADAQQQSIRATVKKSRRVRKEAEPKLRKAGLIR